MTLIRRPSKVGALNHIGIACNDLEASVQQYRDLFDSPAPWYAASEEMGLRAAFIEQGETHIELIQSMRPDTVIAKFIEKYGEGIHHMAFTVDDVDAKLQQLLELGLPMLDQVPREGLGGRIAFTHPSATHGVLIEIITPREPGTAGESA